MFDLLKELKLWNRFQNALLLLLLYIWGTAAYGLDISFSVEDRGQVIGQTASVSSNVILVKNAGGDPRQDMLFDATREILLIVNHGEKSYLQIDHPTIDQVAAIVESVGAAVESQQGVLADLLGTLGISTEDKVVATLKDAGRDLEIGNYPCRLHQGHIDGQLQSEICIAENRHLQLPEADFQTLRTFMQFGNQLLERGGKLLTMMGVPLLQMDLATISGLPIGIHAAKDKLKVRLTKVSPNNQPLQFGVPKGYRKTTIPFIAG